MKSAVAIGLESIKALEGHLITYIIHMLEKQFPISGQSSKTLFNQFQDSQGKNRKFT